MTVEAISHHFSDGLYAKQMELKSGYKAVSHSHKYAHLSVLAQGKVVVNANSALTEYNAPACINIEANIQHEITALEDVVWYCIHATDETDVNKIDKVLIKE